MIDRPDLKIIRYFYVDAPSYKAAKPGQPMPNGTTLVMADKKAKMGADGQPTLAKDGHMVAYGDFFRVLVQKKGKGWGDWSMRPNSISCTRISLSSFKTLISAWSRGKGGPKGTYIACSRDCQTVYESLPMLVSDCTSVTHLSRPQKGNGQGTLSRLPHQWSKESRSH